VPERSGNQFKAFAIPKNKQRAAAWLDFALSIGLAEVVAKTAAINMPSRRVMDKIGMHYDPSDDDECSTTHIRPGRMSSIALAIRTRGVGA
jgi:RimJ/RimL family protein N-acetyltransferase